MPKVLVTFFIDYFFPFSWFSFDFRHDIFVTQFILKKFLNCEVIEGGKVLRKCKKLSFNQVFLKLICFVCF